MEKSHFALTAFLIFGVLATASHAEDITRPKQPVADGPAAVFQPDGLDVPTMTIPHLGLDSPGLTTKETIAAEKEAILRPKASAPIPIAVSPPPLVRKNQIEPQAVACNGTGDLGKLLSPECLASLRALRVPENLNPSQFPQGSSSASFGTLTCTVSIAGQEALQHGPVSMQPKASTLAMTSFRTGDLAQCIETGARLSYGIQGVSNIMATDGTNPVIAVACRRDMPDGKRIACSAQPGLGG